MPRLIKVRNKNLEVLVDEEDYEYLNQFKWHLHSGGYVNRNQKYKVKPQKTYMHREIMGLPEGKSIDHINGNKLDNRKSNLRIVTKSQNMRNQKKSSNRTSIYKGVSQILNRSKKWQAKIKFGGKTYRIGEYFTEQEAALAYNQAAIKHFGEYAKLNEIK